MADLQGLVDALAAEVGRPAGIDDRQLRAVAYSSHIDDVDAVRVASILQREAPVKVKSWLESLGIQDAVGITRVAANPELAMAARVCATLRFDGALLGYLWLIDEPIPLSDAALADVARYAEQFSVALYTARRIEHGDRERELALLAQIAGLRDGDPRVAASELIHGGFLASAVSYAVLVLQAFRADSDEMPDTVRLRLAAAAEHVRRRAPPRHLLLSVAGDQVIGFLACDGAGVLERRGHALAAAAEQHLADTPGWQALVAAADERTSISQLPDAYQEARQALRIARAVGAPGTLVSWSSLGAYRALAELLGERDARSLLSPAFGRLLVASDASVLLETLERYLDNGGDARASAAQLYIHRSSLYGRLRRIEEIAAVDLRSGEHRLELHLALRLWRLDGGGPPPNPTAVASSAVRTQPPVVEPQRDRA
jgi:hypothetical protein